METQTEHICVEKSNKIMAHFLQYLIAWNQKDYDHNDMAKSTGNRLSFVEEST